MANSEDNKSYQTLLCSNFEILSVTTSISNSNLDFFQPNRQNDLILDSTQKFSNLRLEDWRKTQVFFSSNFVDYKQQTMRTKICFDFN